MTDSPSLRDALSMLLELKFLSEEELTLWKNLTDTLSNEQAQQLWDLLGQENEQLEEAFGSLQTYLDHFGTIKDKRIAFLQKLKEDASLAPAVDALLEPVEPFSDEELQALFEDQEKAATLLAALSTIQIEGLKEAFTAMNEAGELEEGYDDYMAFLNSVQEEAFSNEKETVEALHVLNDSVASALKLTGQIARLKDIQAEDS